MKISKSGQITKKSYSLHNRKKELKEEYEEVDNEMLSYIIALEKDKEKLKETIDKKDKILKDYDTKAQIKLNPYI